MRFIAIHIRSLILKKPTLIQSLTSLIVFLLFYTFALTATAQNYYPAEIGNEWILDRTDGKERQTYTLEVPEDGADKDLILLKIETKNLNNNKVVDTDQYFLTDEPDGIKLHKTILQQQLELATGTARANLTTPVIFFPNELPLGKKWDIMTDAVINILETDIDLVSTTNLEVVAIESVETKVGTFHDCAKIQLKLSVVAAGGNIKLVEPTTSYQWLAPNVGPVQFENSDGNVYKITSFKRSPPPVIEAQNLPVWSLLNRNITVTGTRLGGILNAKILENIEDYVSEPDKLLNLGIVSVTGNIVQLGDGTGFATNSQGKQDLWIAGRFDNAPIIGTIILFAENSKGRRPITITVTINVSQ